jgi:hypothetical protein
MDGLYLMLLGSVAFLLFGFVLISMDRVPLMDFRTAYYSGKCLLHQHCDPYSENDIQRLWAQHPERFAVAGHSSLVVTRDVYLPSAFPFTATMALLPFTAAEVLWFLLISGSTIVACFLMWNAAVNQMPVLAGSLLCFCLANSGSLLYFGNPAGFVVPLTVIAAWCIIREKFVWAGIAFLVVGLAFKPHDAGLIWLYFLLAGGTYRKRALQALALVTVICLPVVLWVTHVSPHWPQQISDTLAIFSSRGGMNDPTAGHGTCVLTNIQTVTSFFLGNQSTYNLAAYILCAPLFLVWALITLRTRPSAQQASFALASIAALSMLPFYHRQYDAKLIILAVPALAILWARRDKLAWTGLTVTSAAFILNGDLPWVVFIAVVKRLHLSSAGAPGRLITAIWDFPVPLSLLAMGVFYLWIYARSSLNPASAEESLETESIPLPPAVAG